MGEMKSEMALISTEELRELRLLKEQMEERDEVGKVSVSREEYLELRAAKTITDAARELRSTSLSLRLKQNLETNNKQDMRDLFHELMQDNMILNQELRRKQKEVINVTSTL